MKNPGRVEDHIGAAPFSAVSRLCHAVLSGAGEKAMKRNWKIRMGKWRRYFLFLGEYLFLEKPRGLDFTMRDTRILDVGCGKGVVLKEAAGFPFERIAGIELQEGLVETAERNFRILKSRKNDSPMTFIYHNPQYLDVLEGRAERFARDPARIRKAPELCSCFEQGDMMKLLPQMAARGEVYDVVNADRMLDMVPDAGEDGGGIPSSGRNGIWPGDCGGFSERMNSARTY